MSGAAAAADSEGEEEEEEEEDFASLALRIDSAVAQCLFLLYGVDLPWRDAQWGGSGQVRRGAKTLKPQT